MDEIHVHHPEVYILRRLRHPSVITLLDAFIRMSPDHADLLLLDDDALKDKSVVTNLKRHSCPSMYMVFESMDLNLQSYSQRLEGILSEEQQQYILFQLLT